MQILFSKRDEVALIRVGTLGTCAGVGDGFEFDVSLAHLRRPRRAARPSPLRQRRATSSRMLSTTDTSWRRSDWSR